MLRIISGELIHFVSSVVLCFLLLANFIDIISDLMNLLQLMQADLDNAFLQIAKKEQT